MQELFFEPIQEVTQPIKFQLIQNIFDWSTLTCYEFTVTVSIDIS